MQDKKCIESDLKAVIKLITNTKVLIKKYHVNNELVIISDAINNPQDNSKSNKGIDNRKKQRTKNKYEDLKSKEMNR